MPMTKPTKPEPRSSDAFPVDWGEWHDEWSYWLRQHRGQLRTTQVRFPGKNFLADEVIGTWWIKGRVVELSEVTFPNLSERDAAGRLVDKMTRGIGITYKVGADAESGGVVHSFAELERELGI